MQELRIVAVSEDGSYAVLAVPGRGGRFSLPIDDRLRIVARGQFSRLAQYEIEVESPLRPKEIQDRIRDMLPDPIPAASEDNTGAIPAIID